MKTIDRFATLFLVLITLLSSCQNDDSLRICFAGDLLLDRGVRKVIEHKGADALFRDVKPVLKEYDFVVANLECPVTKSETPVNKKYIFRGEPQWLNALKNAGITHLVLANNHSVDQGRSGLHDTYRNLLNYGLIPAGAGNNHQEACNPMILSKNGIRIALFSSVFIPIENWTFLEDTFCICQAPATDLAANIKNWKTEHPDHFVFVSLHWGIEYAPEPEASAVSAAHLLIDSGADAVVGHHPHVVQTVEFYKEKPIVYSLGNFVFDQERPAMLAVFRVSATEIIPDWIPLEIKGCVPLF